MESLSDRQVRALLHDWHFYARPDQLPPLGDWSIWLIKAGRGWGKTRTGAEWVRLLVEEHGYSRIALVGDTVADVRDVMVRGESGLLAICPSWNRPTYQPSKRVLTWPNGAIATTYSADAPDQLRGPQHEAAWADEPAKWRYGDEAFSNLEMGLRLGKRPQICATTTPRATKFIRDLIADPQTVVTSGSTYDNADNLPASFIDRVVRRFEGTRLGRQELHGAILDDAPGALWKRDVMIEAHRVTEFPLLRRIVVGVDPAASSSEHAAETGIIVAGIADNGHGYVLDDATLHGSPHEWATAVVAAYRKHKADRIVAEVNHGGEMVEATIRAVDKTVAYTAVRASRGKAIRAEPVSALYERSLIHHVGYFADLEDQLTSWCPGDASPDRLDALVWALTELYGIGQEEVLSMPFAFGSAARRT